MLPSQSEFSWQANEFNEWPCDEDCSTQGVGVWIVLDSYTVDHGGGIAFAPTSQVEFVELAKEKRKNDGDFPSTAPGEATTMLAIIELHVSIFM